MERTQTSRSRQEKGKKGTKPIWIIGFMLYGHASGIDLQNVAIVCAFTMTSNYVSNKGYYMMRPDLSYLWITAALFCSFMHSFSEGQATDRKKGQKKESTDEGIICDYEPLLDALLANSLEESRLHGLVIIVCFGAAYMHHSISCTSCGILKFLV